ncbi:MAG TPA: hypothetical protein VK163_15880 [Opitutaceae bacterium]|nr:hypothetical protein [Opitutaceae bacterium]
MKTKLAFTAFLLLLPALLSAQTDTSSIVDSPDQYGRRQTGDWEATVGGSGVSNNDLDNSLGGVDFSVGRFATDSLLLSVRQSVSYANGAGGDAKWDGSTFLALDQHFGTGRLQPFAGVNLGGLYGGRTSDTWAAGVEAGVKYYVAPRTFVRALVNYAWTFNDSDAASDNFDNGAFLWSLGAGFNF